MLGSLNGTIDPRAYNGGILVVATVIVLASLAAITGLALWSSRDADSLRASEAGHSLTRALEFEIGSTFLSTDFAIRAVAKNLGDPDLINISPSLRQRVIFDGAQSVQNLISVLVLDEKGDVVSSSRRIEGDRRSNRASRNYFQYHLNSNSFASYVGEPIKEQATGTPVITLSRRLRHKDSEFAGVVVGAIELDYFKRLFEQTALGGAGNITLAHTDGTVIMRWPYSDEMIGRNVSNAALFEHLRNSTVGQFETKTLIDGEHRLVTYRQVKNLPMIVSVGQSTKAIYSSWLRDAILWCSVIVVLCALAIVFLLLLLRELTARTEAELRNRLLADLDPLTELHNRRYLDFASKREWLRARRNGEELSVALLDVDDFKGINDRLGHHHGDDILKRLGNAIQSTFRRGADVSARYGGDEFIVMLPETSALGALEVVGKCLARFKRDCEQGDITAPTLSVGIAAMIPQPGQAFQQLVEAADSALYAAKAGGRDQVVIASAVRPTEPNVVPLKASKQ